MCFVVIITATVLNYSLVNFLLFGITWTFIWFIWCYHCCIVGYYFPGYYFIVSYHLGLRLKSFAKRVKIFKNLVNRFSIGANSLRIQKLLYNHNDLCLQISHYNKYWKKYLSLTLTIFITLICFLSYLVFFPPMHWLLRTEFVIALSAHILLVLIVTYSASSVSYFNQILFRDLNSIFIESKFSADMKLKVSLNDSLF